ncbi:EAL domain-containing protein [uncultured Cohaesibacter sp.]|uniref:EAL domain-containing protein n=1 Tax=uncultured Cohaesibacter sp. TaxID=1002546 RepID=UPI0029C7A893|nr:EAL domain-containing protein [uncultured Cohaesibacter sp.]
MKTFAPYRFLAILAVFLGCAIASNNGYFYYLNHTLAEKRMSLDKKPSTGRIALLEIDNKSLTAIGTWPWKRSIYADIVEKAFSAGAEELAFDIDFSASSSPKEDQAFQKALENAEGPVTLALFQQHNISDTSKATIQTNRPIAALEESAWLATVNVLADPDGVIRNFPLAQEVDGVSYLSLTSVLGGVQTITPGTFIVDYGLDPDTIPTYSVIDLLEGRLPADALQSRKVLIGAGAAELRDTLAVPVVGMISGPKMQILAAENLLMGRALTMAPTLWTMLLSGCVFAILLVLVMSKKASSYLKFAGLIGLSLGVELVALIIYFKQPLILQTGMVQAQIVGSAVMLTLFEIRFKDLLLTLTLRRNQSISAFLQTIIKDSFSGIIIITEEGLILEISEQAKTILKRLGYVVDEGEMIDRTLPGEMIDVLFDMVVSSLEDASEQMLRTLEIQSGGDCCYLEYSITPSVVTTNQQEDAHDRRVITMMFHDITDAHKEQMRLEYLADHDPATDLLNRSSFCNLVTERLQDAYENGATNQSALIFACQGSRMQKVAQSLGSDYLDQLIRDIAARLSKLKGFDIVGSAEQSVFLLFAYGATDDKAPELIATIRQCVEAPYSVRGHDIMIGCQVGVVDLQQGGTDAHDLVRAATVALHRSREDGVDHMIYTSDLAADVMQRRELEREVLGALERDEFQLCYQPQVNLRTGETIGCEALIRWHHADLGLIRPDLFIPIVEENGMIVDLGRWIIETACRDAMSWPKDVTVAVNVSAVQFVRSDVLQDIRQALKITGLPKERLHIEITESLFIADPDAIITQLNAIREDGIKIALDDFGTGYSSLSYIHQFPLDKIKIDRAFVKDLPHSLDSLAVINAVTALARGFDMSIVAEGMENEAQAEALRIAGCQIGQGYFFGKPMSQLEFTQHLVSEMDSPAPTKLAAG